MWGELSWRGAAKFLGTIFVSLLMMTSLMAFDAPRPVPNTEWPPIYPGVQQVEVRLNDAPPRGMIAVKVLTYKAQATPDALMDFYHEALVREGWLESPTHQLDPIRYRYSDKRMHFTYPHANPCSMWYILGLAIEPVDSEESAVKVELRYGSCR